MPSGASGSSKIKGGRWTVIRFFFVSLAFTIAWMTVSSLLAHYKLLYGPAILLKMNIAYFLPSIPLLVASSCVDEWLDRKFGNAKTILMRQLFGLGGCAAVTAVWPFAHKSQRALLSLTVVLGLVSGMAFSASYQLVARFANKNTISLGLGCVGSGFVTLAFQLALAMGPTPTRRQELLLFELTAGVILLGMLASCSLLLRHWSAVEASAPQPAKQDPVQQPLLDDAEQHHAEEEPALLPPPERLSETRRSMKLRRSLSLMLKYSALDPFDTVSDPERMEEEEGDLPFLDLSPTRLRRARLKEAFLRETPSEGGAPPEAPAMQSAFAAASCQDVSGQEDPESTSVPAQPPEALPPVGLLDLLRQLWPIMAAQFLVGVMLCSVFPFFTYVPSSGAVGDSLPKVLFFIRLFADISGRTLPRVRILAVTSQRVLFALACLATATLPLFFLYLKAPPRLLDDYVVMGYVVGLWGVLGYINTCAYILAPQRVSPHARSAANGALASIYQTSHCLGLLIALALALALYGHLGV